jgi:parvulin-like peptidyl-prolyl isomerase
MDAATKEELKAAQKMALDELIDQELLRSKAVVHAPGLKVSNTEIDARMKLMVSRFPSQQEMERAMKSQGIADLNQLRDRIASRIQQEKYVETSIGPLCKVTDEEARKWFDDHREELVIPERLEVRHVFLPTLDHPSEEAEVKLKAALADLTEKRKDFAALAKELSEDPANKDDGGSLGWMTRRRLPEDFADAVFALPLNQPSLIRSYLGWHIVEVTGRKPAEPQTFEQAKPEIIAALEAVKRAKTVDHARAALRKEYAGRIEILDDTLRN